MSLEKYLGIEYGLNTFYEINHFKFRDDTKEILVKLLFKMNDTFFYANTYHSNFKNHINNIEWLVDGKIKNPLINYDNENANIIAKTRHSVFNEFNYAYGDNVLTFRDRPSFLLKKITELVNVNLTDSLEESIYLDSLYNVEFLDGTKIDFINLPKETNLEVVGFKTIENPK